MIHIADPLYRIIDLPDEIKPMLDHPYVQRLRRLKQLGTVNIVYPSANHTRFEHSLGTAYLAYLMSKNLDLDTTFFVIAGLLHDIGHGPFSHVFERVSEEYGIKHEDLSAIKIKEMRNDISNLGYNYKELIREITGNGFGIVAGSIDADRMDYLQRDSYFTGNFAGTKNVFYIINNVDIVDNRIVIKEKALTEIEVLLFSRIIMFKRVYMHKTAIASSILIENAIRELLDYYGIRELSEFDDYMLVCKLKDIKSKFYHKFENRILPKIVLELPLDNIKYSQKEYEILKSELFSYFGEEIYIYPKRKISPKMMDDIKIVTRSGEVLPFYNVSKLYNTLREYENTLNVLRIYVDQDILRKYNIDDVKMKVAKIVKEILID